MGDRLGHLLGAGEAAQRHGSAPALTLLGGQVGEDPRRHRRLDEAGADGVAADASGAVVEGPADLTSPITPCLLAQ